MVFPRVRASLRRHAEHSAARIIAPHCELTENVTRLTHVGTVLLPQWVAIVLEQSNLMPCDIPTCAILNLHQTTLRVTICLSQATVRYQSDASDAPPQAGLIL
jgi:hypothetical protein